ncbi:MAG: alcohol dehydrogenase catalytic domain-containing protein [Armatimonadetes bacterium]|nr:alcohol dehydrogenase catalytic domain-containing protein [Armatimonadota bacterium]
MRAVVLHGQEDARLEHVPVPPVGRGEIRVRIQAALTCGTDLKVFRRGYHARMIVPPAIFGHEFAGVIDAIGADVAGWQPGDRVVAANSAPCGQCFYCDAGREELCEDLLFLNGAYAEYITVPERIVRRNLLRVPETLSFEAAALVEPLACAVHGVAETGVRTGETVAILGAGPLGLLLARGAVLVGARVLVLGRRAARLQAARAMGAVEALDVGSGVDPREWVQARTGGRGADRVIEAVGQPRVWEQAIALARPGGTVNLFGGCPAGTTVTVDTGRLHYDALTLLGSFHHTPRTIREALRLLAEGRVPAAVLIQERTALDELPDLLPRLARGDGPLKVAVRP